MDNQENVNAQSRPAAPSQDADRAPLAALHLGRYSAELENANAQPTVLGQLTSREPLRALPLSKHPADQSYASARTAALRQHADRALPEGRPQAAQRPRLRHPGNLNLTRKLGAPARKPARASERAPEPSLLSTQPMEASQAAEAPEMSKGSRMDSQRSRPAARGACDSAEKAPMSKMTENSSQQSRPSSGEVELTRRPPLSSSRPNQQHQPECLGSAARTVDSASEVIPTPMWHHKCMLTPPRTFQP